MNIYVDIDNTITKTTNTDYVSATPIKKYIEIVNKLYEQGHYIVYWTARGVGSGVDYYDLTEKQLKKWGCKYHKLKCDKPVYDIFIDDKTLNSIEDLYI
jgi:hydroxymethylpyrimidine pyrophosphatase-like HAD family hydrolase